MSAPLPLDQPPIAPRRGPAIALALAPVVFVGGWAIVGATWSGYSAQRQAISDLAAVDSPRRWVMFAVFVTYGVLMLIGSQAIRASVVRTAWPAAAINGLALIGVAAFPIHHSAWMDDRHGNAALVAYLSIALLPVLAAPGLSRAGRRGAAMVSVVVGIASITSLSMAYGNDHVGWFQRAGAGFGDAWILWLAISLLTNRLTPDASQ